MRGRGRSNGWVRQRQRRDWAAAGGAHLARRGGDPHLLDAVAGEQLHRGGVPPRPQVLPVEAAGQALEQVHPEVLLGRDEGPGDAQLLLLHPRVLVDPQHHEVLQHGVLRVDVQRRPRADARREERREQHRVGGQLQLLAAQRITLPRLVLQQVGVGDVAVGAEGVAVGVAHRGAAEHALLHRAPLRLAAGAAGLRRARASCCCIVAAAARAEAAV